MMRAALLSAFLLSLLPAQEPLPLSCAVPRDMQFYVHGMTSRTPDPGWARFERAVGMLAESGIHHDLLELATLDLSPRQREQVLGAVQHAWGLLGTVDWPLLAAREVVFAYRLQLPVPEYLAVFRVPEPRGKEQLAAMRTMLGGFAEMFGLPPEAVREVERQGGNVLVLGEQGIPIQFAAGAVGDVLVVGTSQRVVSASLRLLEQGAEGRSLGTGERFRQGMAALPAASEDALYVDVLGLVDFYRQALRMALVSASGRGEGARQSREVIGAVLSLLDEFDVIENVQTTTRCDGVTTTSTSRIRLVDDFAATAMATVVARQEPWQDWHRRVPADATSFVFDTGFDCAALFDLVTEHLREAEFLDTLMTEREPMLAAVRAGIGHVSGEIAWVTLPAEAAGAADETVCFLRLADPAAIRDLLPRWLTAAQGFLAGRGQRMSVHAEGTMHEIELTAFPGFRPVVGVRGAELVLASSPGALRRIDQVQAGQAPSIRSREDFAALGLGRQDAVEGLAFGEVTAGMGGLPDLMSAAGFFLSLLPADRDMRPLIKVGAILTKLAPAMRELDADYLWATETLPGKEPDTWFVRTIYRYRDNR